MLKQILRSIKGGGNKKTLCVAGNSNTGQKKNNGFPTNPYASKFFRKFRKLTLQMFSYDALLNLQSIKSVA